MIFLIPILLTGMCSLVYQVVWQKYLTFLLGSESRSTTIIVAIFLLGLALGYFLFGKLTDRYNQRKSLLKFYGWIEMLTGFYAILFPSFFWLVAESSLSQSSSYGMNILLGFILIIIPTALMGATIPLMTTILPKSHLNINNFHSTIYGTNTIGGFVGVLIGSFVLVPRFGLEMTLILSGTVNCIASLFYIGNRLEGDVVNADTQSHIPSNISPNMLYIWSFLSGLVVIGLEILWFRLLGLTIGPSHLVFPFVLSIFILGLGYGSLTSKINGLDGLKKELIFSYCFLLLSMLVAPWLPWVFSNIRVMLNSIVPSYYLFYFLIYIFMCLILLPAIIPMGRLLPAIYSLTKKDDKNFGFECGKLYFINTCGTFIGATIFGYLLFFVLQIDTLYKILILLYGLVLLSLIHSQSKLSMRFYKYMLLIFCVLFFPFNRLFHAESPFRETKPIARFHFTNPFKIHYINREILFFEDGPDNTSAVVQVNLRDSPDVISRSIMVNGKSDSNTLGDYPTLVLSAIIPYLYAPPVDDLKVSIIGAGTGVTAATLINAIDVQKLHLIEISSSVLKALKYFDDVNNGLTQSSKLAIHQMDAFRYYRNLKEKHDLIISEPTNPWTVGVENLYTKYFYELVSDKLSEDGVFYQWFNLYASNDKILVSVIKNMSESFPYIEVYRTMNGDIGLLGSMKALTNSPSWDRVSNSDLKNKMELAGLLDPRHLDALNVFNFHDVNAILKSNDYYDHDIDYPVLNFLSLKPFFLEQSVQLQSLLSPYLARRLTLDFNLRKMAILKNEIENRKNDPKWCFKIGPYPNHYCAYMKEVVSQYDTYTTSSNLTEKLLAHSFLRKERFINKDIDLLTDAEDEFANLKSENILLILEYLKEGMAEKAEAIKVKLISNKSLTIEEDFYLKEEWEKYLKANSIIENRP